MKTETDNVKTQEGIGLFKIKYEMDVKNSARDQNYIAGVIAYNSKEAIDSLVDFAKKRVKGFKGLKIDEVAFEGSCHSMSDRVRDAILRDAINKGKVVLREDYDALLEKKPTKKVTKKSILPENKE